MLLLPSFLWGLEGHVTHGGPEFKWDLPDFGAQL